jgi:hypothetical protein
VDEALARAVPERAGHRCEYCLVPAAAYHTPFEIDHIVARQHGGQATPSNLAYSCLHCNSHKGPNIAGLDPVTRKITRLFHPRLHKWSHHFRWDGAHLVGRTAIGRTTIMVLNMNDGAAVEVRAALLDEAVFP